MSEAPKKIWLQTGCEDSGCDGDCSFNELGEVTWCEDQIHNDDIQYIRADPPLNGDQILEGFKATGLWEDGERFRAFTEGVRFAERMRDE